MLSGKLVKILKEKCPEERILKKVKSAVEANKQGTLNSIKKNRYGVAVESPLSLAAELGFCTVLRYLIEETGIRKPDPDQLLIGNQTALGIALCKDQYSAALYLAEHTNHYPQDIRWGYTSLHYAAGRNQAEIVNIILSKNPNIIDLPSKEGLTALHLAVEYNALNAVDTLIKCGADLRLRTNQDATAYGLALSMANHRMISRLLNHPLAASALEYTFCSIRLSPFKFIMDSSNATKLPSVMALLQAGAGLDLDEIPEDVWGLLKKFGQQRTSSWECLIVGDLKTEQDRPARKQFVTSVADFEIMLNNPNASFELKQLGLSVQHPRICALKHVQSIAALIQSKLADPLPIYTQDKENLEFSEIINFKRAEDIKNLTKVELCLNFELERTLFENETQRFIPQLFMIFNYLKSSISQDEANFDTRHIFDAYLLRLHEVLKWIPHKKSIYLVGFDDVQYNFSNAFANVLTLVSMPEFEQFAVKIMTPFVNNLGRVMQAYSQDLRSKRPNLYNMLLDSKICSMLEVARAYLKLGHFDLAQTLAQQVIYESSKIIFNNESLAQSINQAKAQALVMLAEVHIHEERFRAAFDCLEKMFENSEDHLQVCRGLSQVMMLVLEYQGVKVRPKVIQLLRKAVSYLSQFQSEPKGSYSELLLNLESKSLDYFKSQLNCLEEELLISRKKLLDLQFKLVAHLDFSSKEKSVAICIMDGVIHSKNKRRFRTGLINKNRII